MSNAIDRIHLQRPAATDDPAVTAFRWEDEARYDDQAPWPTVADGGGASLQRLSATSFGGSLVGWRAAPPSPGIALFPDPDLNGDAQLDVADVDRLCQGVREANASADLNGDGQANQIDLQSYLHAYFGSTVGDSNLDGWFDSGDLVAVFAAGQYEDGVAANSTWATGDWNCDQEFDTRDLVAAVSAGGFRATAPVAAHAVALSRPAGRASTALRRLTDIAAAVDPSSQAREANGETRQDEVHGKQVPGEARRPSTLSPNEIDEIFANYR